MMVMNTITNFDTPELLAEAAANYFIQLANDCIEKKRKFTVALSGGNTPMALYQLLASPTFSTQIDWKKVFIFWGDERCVPLDSSDNNAFNAKNIFLNKIKIPAKNIFTIPVDETPVNAAIYYEATIKIFFKTDKPIFDLILLGMGDDGHTASLFPHSTILQEKSKLVREVFVADKNVWRVSLTEPIINAALHKLFLIAGKAKTPLLKIILYGEKNTEKYPAQMIENAEWFVAV
jgi:6-phosphogluconolactonase